MTSEENDSLSDKRRLWIESLLSNDFPNESEQLRLSKDSPDGDLALSAARLLKEERYALSPAGEWCRALLLDRAPTSLIDFFRDEWRDGVHPSKSSHLNSLFWELSGFDQEVRRFPGGPPRLEGVGQLAIGFIESMLEGDEGPNGYSDLRELCALAFGCGTLEKEFFERVVRRSSDTWRDSPLVDTTREKLINYQFQKVEPADDSPKGYALKVMSGLAGWFSEFMPRWLEELPEEVWGILGSHGMGGPEPLIAACRAIERHKMTSLAHESYPISREKVVTTLLEGWLSEDQLADPDLLKQLESFEDLTLSFVADHHNDAKALVLSILERRGGRPAWLDVRDRLIADLVRKEDYLESAKAPDSGSISAPELRSMIAALTKEEYEVFRSSLHGDETQEMILLALDALEGRNEKKLAASIKRHAQMPLKFYQLLPLPEDAQARADEVARRYAMIDGFLAKSKSFGAERRANSQVCAEVAMENLATNAGYGSSDELFFRMEAGRSKDPADLAIEDGEYRVEVGSADGLPVISVVKAGKPLKTVPAALKKVAAFKELKTTCEEMAKQRGRFLRALEGKMSVASQFQVDQLMELWNAPLLRELLSRLVFITSDDQVGMMDSESHAMKDLKGDILPIEGRSLAIAHPVVLHRLGVLEGWRRRCFEQEVVQPFRQLFREFYMLTDAEKQTSPKSQRFAGQTMATPPLSGLMKTRLWKPAGPDGLEPRKAFGGTGLTAHFDIVDGGHFLTETETVTSGEVYFTNNMREYVDLGEVPEVLFSEAMRDADLFVSVAQTLENGVPSKELLAQRLEIMSGLVQKLKLKGVSHSGHHALVEGTRTNYRIHLGSGAVHMGPGNHLCIVPKQAWKRPAKVFLPFLDDDDPKISEIFSKILMLSADDKIRDHVILAQIDQAIPD